MVLVRHLEQLHVGIHITVHKIQSRAIVVSDSILKQGIFKHFQAFSGIFSKVVKPGSISKFVFQCKTAHIFHLIDNWRRTIAAARCIIRSKERDVCHQDPYIIVFFCTITADRNQNCNVQTRRTLYTQNQSSGNASLLQSNKLRNKHFRISR